MFDIKNRRGIRRLALGLAFLSLVTLILTAWILLDVAREQEILASIIKHLPRGDLEAAAELSGDLRLQSGLSILLILNSIGTAIAIAFVIRGYMTSEQSLRDVKVLATDILASMDAGVITTDHKGIITSINPHGIKLLGLEDAGIGTSLADINPEHGLLGTICEEVDQHHDAIRDLDYCINSNGHEKTLRAGCTLLKNQRGEEIGTVIHVRDVTEKALMESRLRRMERYMGLGSLAAGLQHEIKNPLSALSLHIQLLCEKFNQEPTDAEIVELLDVLQTEVRRINDVLDGFRNYASSTQLGQSWVDLSVLIEKLVRLLRPQMKAQNISVKVEMPAKPPASIEADSVRLEQVLLNLALNAMAAMPEGGELCFRLSEQNHFLKIDVADTGKGIPPEIQSQIFDPYFTTRNDGTGMGLALCDKIIRQHEGNIDFHSSPQGTEFTILLPMVNEY
ncbi:ATP-binding protein [uncultured Rubinisphaera sp.]|uniref:two-component system sensor histidine kinase NtrB n=1 Tax=uncultured Rubinisphaera sp. TaxID=1678686 RepID=UPI000ED5F5D6|nr:PAS domain-containing sensor histidine kinase [Planctomycetaceae bacterium]|tara:strand:- start:41640 stop:42989 length:1350 start_codon:yes stop_codon:yes gene_type:complete